MRVESMEIFFQLHQQVLFLKGQSFESRQSNEMFQLIHEDMVFLKGPSSKNRQ